MADGQLAGKQPSAMCALRAIPVVAGGSGITQLSAGQDHVLALTGGTILAWRLNIDSADYPRHLSAVSAVSGSFQRPQAQSPWGAASSGLETHSG